MLSNITEATVLVCAFVTLMATCSALFCALVGGCFAYLYGIKLREYKPRGFLISDISAGSYKLRQGEDGDWEISVPDLDEDPDDAAVEHTAMDEAEFDKWMFGTTSQRR